MISRPARAKINLGLHVLRRRADGYHDIETVFLPIDWSDSITVEAEETLTFTCDDEVLNRNDNLCLRAADLLRERTETIRGARIHLAKRLPYGAGLGGGSSDAATTLRLLNELWSLDLSTEELQQLGSKIGSDVPFLLQDDAAYGSGRGELLSPLSMAGPFVFPFDIVVALPDTRVSTPDAYGAVTPDDDHRPDLRQLVHSLDLEVWRKELVNDFEGAIFDAFPEISALKNALYDAGAGYASMSGSGSAVYGLFTDTAMASAATQMLHDNGLTVWHGRSTR